MRVFSEDVGLGQAIPWISSHDIQAIALEIRYGQLNKVPETVLSSDLAGVSDMEG